MNNFWRFLTDIFDNDTLIIAGMLSVLIIGCFYTEGLVKDAQMIIIGGLLSTLKTKKGV